MKKLIYSVALTVFIACGPSKQVSRLSTDTVTDLSGNWNDTDANLVADGMISNLINHPWAAKFTKKQDREPVVVIGKIKNKTTEHINTNFFIKSLEKEIINSGTIEFVASKKEREELREERLDQQSNSSMSTAKQMGNETGADYMLQGEISTTEDAIDGKKAIVYQVTLELIHIETNQKVWLNDKKIKKYIAKDKYKL